MQSQNKEAIKVALRVRPLNQRQITMEAKNCIEFLQKGICIHNQAGGKVFQFDYQFSQEAKQLQIYQACCRQIIDSALKGYNGTVITYGQTGAGKSYTIFGAHKQGGQMGVLPRSFHHIMNCAQNQQGIRYKIYCSFVEIYNERLYDLLDSNQQIEKKIRQSKEQGTYIQDLCECQVKTTDQMMKILEKGLITRCTRNTKMGCCSSRGNTIFTIRIQSSDNFSGKLVQRVSKLNFVELAGSQKIGKTGASGQTLEEAKMIGKSLGSLTNVISALASQNKFVPYRDCKITRLLEDSLGGTAKTLIVINISPASVNYEESLCSMRFGSRAMSIKNCPKVHSKINEQEQKSESHPQVEPDKKIESQQ